MGNAPESFEIVLAKIGKTTIYKGGTYVEEDEQLKTVGSVTEYYDIVSVQFNQLKAKIFNLIEASIPNEKQQRALNGLIKEFCNTAYRQTTDDISGLMKRLGFLEENHNVVCGSLAGQYQSENQ